MHVNSIVTAFQMAVTMIPILRKEMGTKTLSDPRSCS